MDLHPHIAQELAAITAGRDPAGQLVADIEAFCHQADTLARRCASFHGETGKHGRHIRAAMALLAALSTNRLVEGDVDEPMVALYMALTARNRRAA